MLWSRTTDEVSIQFWDGRLIMLPFFYYPASSVNGQDESNPALWLVTRADKMELSCPLGTTRRVPQEAFPRKPCNKCFTDQACSVKMTGYWPSSFFASLWTSTPSWSVNRYKKNLANSQPRWPHPWSITHISYTAFQFTLFIYAIYLEYTDVARSQTIFEEYEDMVGLLTIKWRKHLSIAHN